MDIRKLLAVTVLSVSGLFCGTASAVTLEGATMWFTFNDSALDSLWGGFSVSGDTLRFDPTTFKISNTTNGFGSLDSQTPTITITAKDGFRLTTVGLNEKGSYQIQTFGDVPLHEARASGQFYIDGTPMTIDSGLFSTPTGISTPWSLGVQGALANAISTNVKIFNVLDANLFAAVGIGRVSIAKSIIEVWGASTPVPLPPAVWMLGSALVGLVTVGRRRLGI